MNENETPKSDTEESVGEEGKVVFAGYGDFVAHELSEVVDRANDLAKRSSSKLWSHAFMNFAVAADHLQMLYSRQLIEVVECATVGCDMPAEGRTKIDKAEVQGEDERMSSLNLDPIPLCNKCATEAHITEWVEV